MCFGGGSKGSAPTAQYIDPVTGKAFWTSDLLNQAINERETNQRNETAAAKKAIEDKAAEVAAQEAAGTSASQLKFKKSLDEGQTIGRTNALDYFTQQGVDPTPYTSDIEKSLATIGAMIPEMDPNPKGYYAKNPGIDLFTNLQSGAQQRAINSVDSTFGGADFANRLIGDDLIEPTVSRLLDDRFNPLYTQLENAKKRGTLNDVGFSAALNKFNEAKGTAGSTIRNAATSELTRDRGTLKGFRDESLSSAGNLRLGQTFDPGSYFNRAQETAAREKGTFFDDVGNSLVGTEFSNLTDLLNAGGAVQGGTNPSAANPAGAASQGGAVIGGIDDAALADIRRKRQLANQGAF